jgi:hypothetical protein
MDPATIAPPSVSFTALPPLGGELLGGLFAGLTTDKQGRHFAVALLPDKPDQRLPWKKAVEWAAGVDGTLPMRPVAALLFANAKDQFDPEWHWTGEQLDRSCAWYQSFNDGYQYYLLKSFEGRARAVRLISLTA